MRKKFAAALLLAAVLTGSVIPRLTAQKSAPYNCYGGYDGSCAVTWIKNCYC